LYVRTNYGIDLIDAPTDSGDRSPIISNEGAESVARSLIKSKLPNLKLSDEKYDPIDGQPIHAPLGSLQFLGYKSFARDSEQLLSVTVRVKNDSLCFWGGDVLPVNISYRWYDVGGKELDIDSIRTPLPGRGLAKGELKDVVVPVLLPKKDGEYRLKLTIVQEYSAWFDDIGFNAQVINVKLVGGKLVDVSPQN
ncbi:MAG: hypothetical protein JRC99_13890, partial [Deltaproteobacteria bacterium]|nr:hypothetical protein [Deltaproteobacteria bacterium]